MFFGCFSFCVQESFPHHSTDDKVAPSSRHAPQTCKISMLFECVETKLGHERTEGEPLGKNPSR